MSISYKVPSLMEYDAFLIFIWKKTFEDLFISNVKRKT